ncbi:hypothetical protein LEP1GSC186_0755 [Leptospira noguchii serovar Autumnalis str. ZUN142]|uniref:Uncharacterized protein n=1 Tax=Leptospira noguchii serovar Autumnalis str. ZUN142 TaxID=1085540 RepID=M6UI32_9LEPT|nr:hypothetical protein LEP1GSC186_0755 [Leptospira noguchii serovar Autumnalis str. ZUN142]
MLRSVVSSIEFKFRRNWNENEQLSVSLPELSKTLFTKAF